MFRFLTTCAAVYLLVATVAAQTGSPRARRLGTPVRDAGTLHLATGVWTPAAESATGPGATVFNNDAAQPFFLALRRDEKVADFGRIPATTPFAPNVGSVEGQAIDGFQFAYTTREVRGSFGYEVTFYDNYGAQDSPLTREPVATIQLGDLPGARRAGVQASWKVTVNLRNSPYEFILGRDDEGGGSPARFGYSLSCTNTRHGAGGPILAGDPLGTFGPAAGEGQGTNWGGEVGTPGTGLGTEDTLWVQGRRGSGPQYVTDIPNAPISYGSFHLQLYANADQALGASTNIGTNYCDGTASNVLFHDAFDSGDFDGAAWTRTGPVFMEYGGQTWGYQPRIHRGGVLTGVFSTIGKTEVNLRYACRVYDPPVQQWLYSEWSTDGVEWNLIEYFQGGSWWLTDVDLPAGAGQQPALHIRFRFSGGGPAMVGHARIDDMVVEAGSVGHIEAFGSTSVADNDITLVASGVPPEAWGMFFYGSTEVYIPLGIGFRCVGGEGLQRLLPLVRSDETGGVSRALDFTSHPMASSFISDAPTTANFQYWHRENGSNSLTDAIRINLVE